MLPQARGRGNSVERRGAPACPRPRACL